MKKLRRRLLTSLLAVFLIALSSLVITMLNPHWFYQQQTNRGNFTILHDEALPEGLDSILNKAHLLVQQSPHYLPDYQIIICMDDGSRFPRWIEKLKKGRAVSYAHIVVMQQAFDYERGVSVFNEHLWDLTELYAHEITHCYQYELAGFSTLWLPMWKIEGYAEYVSRKVLFPPSLGERYTLLLATKELEQGFRWIETENNYGSPKSYLEALVYVQYLIEKEGFTYPEVLATKLNSSEVEAKLNQWYQMR